MPIGEKCSRRQSRSRGVANRCGTLRLAYVGGRRDRYETREEKGKKSVKTKMKEKELNKERMLRNTIKKSSIARGITSTVKSKGKRIGTSKMRGAGKGESEGAGAWTCARATAWNSQHWLREGAWWIEGVSHRPSAQRRALFSVRRVSSKSTDLNGPFKRKSPEAGVPAVENRDTLKGIDRSQETRVTTTSTGTGTGTTRTMIRDDTIRAIKRYYIVLYSRRDLPFILPGPMILKDKRRKPSKEDFAPRNRSKVKSHTIMCVRLILFHHSCIALHNRAAKFMSG
ncbi:hypothetical protein ALC53_11565 [Atta colombica]|uniref:Uncharacterized protein n=1 Tax=Atta colombica TaxID=520822 RepID=A0A195B1D3_9HYME|nr:hypothetical protein ALC53_11565 [Atta colombica]